jgi:hypothetical protein
MFTSILLMDMRLISKQDPVSSERAQLLKPRRQLSLQTNPYDVREF